MIGIILLVLRPCYQEIPIGIYVGKERGRQVELSNRFGSLPLVPPPRLWICTPEYRLPRAPTLFKPGQITARAVGEHPGLGMSVGSEDISGKLQLWRPVIACGTAICMHKHRLVFMELRRFPAYRHGEQAERAMAQA